MSRTQAWRQSFIFAVAIGLAGCGQTKAPAPPSPANASPPFKLAASIQDIMSFEIEPAAEALWESVSTTVSAEGVEEKRPQTDAEWREMRGHAITLVEATNLLTV